MDRNTIGAARGLGIILVVFAHIVPVSGTLLLPYTFHMPLFFFLSGMTLPVERPIRQVLVKDLWGIVGFYLAVMVIVTALSGMLQSWGVSAPHSSIYNWKTYFLFPFTWNSHHVELFLVGWFLVALFFAKYIAIAVLRIGKVLGQPFLLPAGFAAVVGWAGMSVFTPRFGAAGGWYWNLCAQVCVASMYCIFGALVRQAPITWPQNLLWPAAAAYLLLIWSGAQPMGMSWSRYPSGYTLHVVGTALGITATMLAAHFLRGSGVLAMVGRHSKAIMAWHIVSFAVLNLWYVQMVGFKQAGVLDIYQPAQNWPVYTAAGIILPLALAVVWRAAVWRVKIYLAGPLRGKRFMPEARGLPQS